MRYLIAAGSLVLAALPVAASQPAASGTGPDRVVCRELMRTGSRFTTRTCRTVAEWEKISEDARRSASDVIDRPAVNMLRSN